MSGFSFLLIVVGTFFTAGCVKGVVGLGLPTISLAVLTLIAGLPQAMVLIVLPALFTNIAQAVTGGAFWSVLKRIWPFLLSACLLVWLGARALNEFDSDMLTALLGFLIVAYSAISLIGIKVRIERKYQSSVGVALGVVNGLLTGMTGSFVFPGIFYLQSLGLSRDELVQAMGMLFALSTLALGLALYQQGLASIDVGLISLSGVLPALMGMAVGQRLRRSLSEDAFRNGLLAILILLGLFLIIVSLQSILS